MKRTVCAQPAYFPNLATNASATTILSFGVRLLPASSGNRYCVATCIRLTWLGFKAQQNRLLDHIKIYAAMQGVLLSLLPKVPMYE
jgi:hypothetical protein